MIGPPMIDEKSRRRPGWTDGYPCTLADGQAWTFPRIWLRLTPARDESGRRIAAPAHHANGTDLPDYARWAAIVGGIDPVRGLDYLEPRLVAAAELLALNYDLSDDEIAGLLRWDEQLHAADAPEFDRWAEIDQAILGRLPKPTPAISDSPPG